jgi:hypothetical protein
MIAISAILPKKLNLGKIKTFNFSKNGHILHNVAFE